MFSRRLTRSIAVGATALAIGSGAYGIVSATASTGSGTTTTATLLTSAISAQARIKLAGDPTLGRDRSAGGSDRQGEQRFHLRL